MRAERSAADANDETSANATAAAYPNHVVRLAHRRQDASLDAYRPRYVVTVQLMPKSTRDAHPRMNSLTELCGLPTNVSEITGNASLSILD